MALTTQGSWNRFERWASNYEKKCCKIVGELCAEDYLNSGQNELFLKKWDEVPDILSGGYLTESEILTRLSNKINFLRAYLVNISWDGAKFMNEKSDFLTLQYPSRCDNSLGVWLEKDMEDQSGIYNDPEHFMEFDVSFFCKSIKDVDLASMYSVLPFNHIYFRRPKGKKWNSENVKALIHRVENDLGFDYMVNIQSNYNKSDEILTLDLI